MNEVLEQAVRDFREIDIPALMSGKYRPPPPHMNLMMVETPKDLVLTLNQIAAAIYDINAENIAGFLVRTDLCHVRFTNWHLLQKRLNWSAAQIGRVYNRDHTTILHGLKRFEDCCQTIYQYRERADEIERCWEQECQLPIEAFSK